MEVPLCIPTYGNPLSILTYLWMSHYKYVRWTLQYAYLLTHGILLDAVYATLRRLLLEVGGNASTHQYIYMYIYRERQIQVCVHIHIYIYILLCVFSQLVVCVFIRRIQYKCLRKTIIITINVIMKIICFLILDYNTSNVSCCNTTNMWK